MNVFKWISTVYYHLKIIMSWRHALDLDVYNHNKQKMTSLYCSWAKL